MTKTDDFTLPLPTNDKVIAVNQHGADKRQLFRLAEGLIAWIADVPDSADKHLAVFNTRGKTPATVRLYATRCRAATFGCRTLPAGCVTPDPGTAGRR